MGAPQRWTQVGVAPDVALVLAAYVAQAAVPIGGSRLTVGRSGPGTKTVDLHFHTVTVTSWVVKVSRQILFPDGTVGDIVDIYTTSHSDDVGAPGYDPSLLKEHIYTLGAGNFGDVLEFACSDTPANIIVSVKAVAGVIAAADLVTAVLGG